MGASRMAIMSGALPLSMARAVIPAGELDELRDARDVLRHEAQTILDLSRRLNSSFCSAVAYIRDCRGTAVVTGMGKAGLIGRKIAATFSSTGTRAMYLHPADAVHGDVGCVRADDVVIALSNSGETEELLRLLPILRDLGVPIIAITGDEQSALGRAAQVSLLLGNIREAGTLGLAPTASTTAMLALGDALAMVVSRSKGFTKQEFSRNHPGGSLGRKTTAVSELMRQGEQVRVASERLTVREALVTRGKPERRTGAVMLVDEGGRLSGVFTDSDLVRMLESRRDVQLDEPIRNVMTQTPKTISPDVAVAEAIEVLSVHHISELPVIDRDGRPIGLVDITDLIGVQ
jgi:arabinose-5-phosphate isomerase